MAEDVAGRLARVDEVDELRREVVEQLDELRREVVALRVENESLRGRPSGDPRLPAPVSADRLDGSDATMPAAGIGRRRLLLGGVTAGAAAVVGVVATAQPVAAADGGALVMGQENSATVETKLTTGSTAGNGLRVEGTGGNATIHGHATGSGAEGVRGEHAALGTGVRGVSQDGEGVWGSSSGGVGVQGESDSSLAVYGLSPTGVGVYGQSPSGVGVQGVSANGTGVAASSNNSIAFSANGPTSLLLSSYDGRPAPINDGGFHFAGEVVIAFDEIWLCVANGTPGTWRKVGGPTTAGQLHVLPVPIRIYDSRPGTAPSQGPKTVLSGNVARTIDCTANNSKVPKGATAVSLTVLLADAANTNGNLTIWANGTTRPNANAAVWGTGSGRYSTTAISALDADAKIQVAASQITNVVLDVVGYYR